MSEFIYLLKDNPGVGAFLVIVIFFVTRYCLEEFPTLGKILLSIIILFIIVIFSIAK